MEVIPQELVFLAPLQAIQLNTPGRGALGELGNLFYELFLCCSFSIAIHCYNVCAGACPSSLPRDSHLLLRSPLVIFAAPRKPTAFELRLYPLHKCHLKGRMGTEFVKHHLCLAPHLQLGIAMDFPLFFKYHCTKLRFLCTQS